MSASWREILRRLGARFSNNLCVFAALREIFSCLRLGVRFSGGLGARFLTL